MTDIDKRLEFLARHPLAVQIYMRSGYEAYEPNKVFDDPVEWQEEKHEHAIDWRDRKRHLIAKSDSDNLRSNFPDKKNDPGDKKHRDRDAELARKSHLMRQIDRDERGKTRDRDRDRGRPDQVRDKESFTLLFDALECNSTETVLFYK